LNALGGNKAADIYNYDGFLSGYAAEFDPDATYQQFLASGSANNMKYANSVVDDIITKARHTKNLNERKALYSEFEVAFAKEPASLLIAYLDGNYVLLRHTCNSELRYVFSCFNHSRHLLSRFLNLFKRKRHEAAANYRWLHTYVYTHMSF
jgi:ABC-type transport system substrate-binding protein